MVCQCGHNKDKHESGLDYGYHAWQCTIHSCNCPYYRKVKR